MTETQDPNAGAQGARPAAWWQNDWFFILATILVTASIAFSMARYELISRAKKAYLEGEKY